jgi:hypothetical protein
MASFSAGLGKFVTDLGFQVDAEASERYGERVQDAAFSRLRPIQDGKD